MRTWQTAFGFVALGVALSGWCQVPKDPRWLAADILFHEDFRGDLGAWRVEAEKRGTIQAQNGLLDINVPAGATVWLRRRFEGPLLIQYEAKVVSAGGENDRVSDLNCFWMASDPVSPSDLFVRKRTGAFAGYNSLRMYYVGLGGNGNTTTRFRRYIGDAVERPLLPENDLSIAEHPDIGIVVNKWQTITLVADGRLIQYWRDGVKIFEMVDSEPYTSGWFGIRTTRNHMQVRNLKIVRLLPR